MKKAKLLNKINVDVGDGKIEVLDKRTALSFLHKSKNKYVFCVRKWHGSGKSGIELYKDEFEWKQQ